MPFVCISCGHKASKLFHEYNGGIIKIVICKKCGKFVDKYIEYDLVVVSLDALLLKRQALRHILINSGFQSHWKFCLILLLCEAVTKLLKQSSLDKNRPFTPDNVIYSAFEIDLYWNFLTSLVELLCFITSTVLLMFMWKCLFPDSHMFTIKECACGLILSNFGKIFVLPAILWGHNYSVLYTWLCTIFTVAANVQTLRVLCPTWEVPLLVASVLCGHILAYGSAIWMFQSIPSVT